MKASLVILISGRGSNMDAILAACASGQLQAEPKLVMSNNPHADGLTIATAAGIPSASVDHQKYPDRSVFERAMNAYIEPIRPAIVALAGFMRILTPAFVNAYRGHLINIHPSLLPDFPGLDTHERVLQAGLTTHGASVHFVTPTLDGGPVIAQARVHVNRDDTAGELAARVLAQEHRLYPLTLNWLAEKRLELTPDDRVLFDQQPLTQPLLPFHAAP